jgi:hypothetical protein
VTSEWDQRQLCPDGGCVGVIGDDGKCTVCGKEGSRPRPSTGADEADATADHASEVPDSRSDAGPTPEAEESGSGSGSGSDDWDNRQLCADGACVGVMLDGKCNVCGRSAE